MLPSNLQFISFISLKEDLSPKQTFALAVTLSE